MIKMDSRLRGNDEIEGSFRDVKLKSPLPQES